MRPFKIALLLLVATFAVASASAQEKTANQVVKGFLEVDVAVDNTFGRGTQAGSFYINGYVYPKGTLDDSNGVLEGGGPEFPDLVIARFTCTGWIVGPRANSVPVFATTNQIYEFNLSLAGHDTIYSEGFELAVIGVENTRAILGGTGRFLGRSGEQVQTILGVNASGGTNMTVRFQEVFNYNLKN